MRTLSDSTAQITFRDASRLRLNSNSNAIIKVMRFDPLHRTEEAKVSLVEGDFYALLAGDNARTRFNVEIPQANATIDSGNFWVSNENDNAKFANYDEKPVNVAANGGAVTLGKNEGTVVGKGEKPMAKLAVLPPPTLLTPADNGPVYITTPELTWAPVEKSAGYWLEVSSDQGFDHIVANQFGLDQPKHVMACPAGRRVFLACVGARRLRPAGRAERGLALHRHAGQYAALPQDRRAGAGRHRPRGQGRRLRRDRAQRSADDGRQAARDRRVGAFRRDHRGGERRQHGDAGGDRSRPATRRRSSARSSTCRTSSRSSPSTRASARARRAIS